MIFNSAYKNVVSKMDSDLEKINNSVNHINEELRLLKDDMIVDMNNFKHETITALKSKNEEIDLIKELVDEYEKTNESVISIFADASARRDFSNNTMYRIEKELSVHKREIDDKLILKEEKIENMNKLIEELSIHKREIDDKLISKEEKIGNVSEQIEELIANYMSMHSKTIYVNERLSRLERSIELINKINSESQECEVLKEKPLALYIEKKMNELMLTANQLGKRDKVLKAVFFVQVSETWPSIASIWEAFENDHLWDAKIVVLPFYHPYMDGETISKFLSEEGIDFERSEIYDIDTHRPDIVFYQEPYDSTQPVEYQIESIVDKGYRVGYSSYSVELGGSPDLIKFQFDLPMQNLAWRVFCRSKRHKKMYGKYCSSGNEHVVITGHPKFDMLKNYTPDSEYESLKEKITDRTTVVWNPHFCLDPQNQYSTFLEYKEVILDYFKNNENMFLILRPHPMLYKYLTEHNYMSEKSINDFIDEVAQMKNAYLDRTSSYHMAFHLSDAMISDISSFVIEYLATEKPLLFTRAENGPLLNDDGSIEKYHYTGFSDSQVVGFLNMVKEGADPMKEQRLSIIPEYIFGLDGNAGERIKNCATKNVLIEHYDVENKLIESLKVLKGEIELVNKMK